MRDGWTETTLGELCELYQPETISKAKMDDAASYVVYGANGPVGRYSRFNHEEPQVVVTCRGATCGVVNMTPPNCWITGNAMVVKPRDNRSIKGFLFWALQTSVDVQATISGSAQPQITRTGLEPSKILVPPLDEQKRIVDVVSSVDSYIDALQLQADTARTAFLAVCEGIFSTEENLKPLHEVATVIMGQSPEGNTCNTDGIGTPLLTGPTEFTKVTVGLPRQWTSKETKLSQSGDILFCVRGATAGRINIGNYQSVIGRGLAAIRCETHEDTDLVRYALTVGLGQLLPAAGGTIFPNISQAQLRNFEVLWPSEIRRVELSALLKSIEEVFLSTEQAIVDAKKLRSGLLSDLLSGEHQIPELYDRFLKAA